MVSRSPERSRQRRAEILRLAADGGPANVAELAARFGVTASTIRRDLGRLSGDGRLARTYGGAIAVPAEPSMAQRGGEALAAKRSIAAWAALLLEPGASVLLDAGTTVAQVARILPVEVDLRVTTTSLPVLAQLAGRADVETTCLGGRLRPLSDAFVGPLTEAALERLSFDIAFLGADGVSRDGGLCEAEPEQTRLKELMARRADRVFVLAHAAKLDHRPFHAWARIDGPWTLITDADAPSKIVAEFRAAGIDVIIAQRMES